MSNMKKKKEPSILEELYSTFTTFSYIVAFIVGMALLYTMIDTNHEAKQVTQLSYTLEDN